VHGSDVAVDLGNQLVGALLLATGQGLFELAEGGLE
jgi:hypothetical protein